MTDIITFLLSAIGTVTDLIGFLITDLGIIISVILDPFLLLMIIFTISHFYTVIVSKTRKELIINYFKFFKMAGSGMYTAINAFIPLIIGIVQGVIGLIQGIMSAPPIQILGTGIGIGTIIAVGLLLIMLASVLGGLIDAGLINWISSMVSTVISWFSVSDWSWWPF